MKTLTAQQAMDRAVELAGYADFGAEGFKEGLDRSLDAFSRIPLTETALASAHEKIVYDLATRLRIERWYAEHPEIDSQPIEGPVIVVGLPRSGTTATVGMLALDDRFRYLRMWEAGTPVPPPIVGQEASDPRLVDMLAAAKTYSMSHLHIFDPTGPEEDLALLAGLDAHAYHGAYPMPDDYVDWWMSESFSSTYAYLERVFKLLHSQRPPRLWLLKSPIHLFRLDALATRYPGAKFVFTHRDPLKVLPSVASLHHYLHEERCVPDMLNKKKTGRALLRFWAEGMRRALAARATIGEDRFIDVMNTDVIKKPVETFQRVYAHLGMDAPSDLGARIDDYNRKHAESIGGHAYTLEEYGLSDADVRTAFQTYTSRFGF